MPQWIESDQGLINLDHYSNIRRAQGEISRYGCQLYRAFTPEGNYVNLSWFDPDTLHPVVPAAPGSVAVVISDYSEDERPVESDLDIKEVLIVAWRISAGPHSSAEPVLLSPQSDEQTVFVKHPDGSLERSSMYHFDNLDEAKRELLEQAQNEWDRKQKAAAPKEAADHG